MRPHIIWTIFRKEITEALRDRLTLAAVIGLPLLLYPLMILGMTKVQKAHVESEEERISQVAVWGEAPAALLTRLQTNQLQHTNWAGASEDLQAEFRAGRIQPVGEEDVKASTGTNQNALVEAARQMVLDRNQDAVLIVWPGFNEALTAESLGKISICYDSVRPASEKARDRLTDALRGYRTEIVAQRERAHGLAPGFAAGLEIRSLNLAPAKRQVGERLGLLLPFIVILLSATGGLYASIDITAGEKDRATMQTLLCAPVHNLEIVIGKFLTVWGISLLAAMANVASIGATVARAAAGASSSFFNVAPGTFLLALLLLLPATFTITAFFLALAMTARDAKDAGNFLGASLTMLVMPMMIVMLPGVDLNAWTAFVPLVNLSLLTKAIFLNEARGDTIFLTLVASLLYAALAIVFAARTFGREQILLGGRTSLLGLFLPEKRKDATPTPSLAFTMFALVLVLGYYGSLLLTESGIVTQVLVTQVAFFLLPVVAMAAWMKFPPTQVLSFRAPPVKGLLAAVLIGATGWAAVGGLVMRLLPPPDSLVKALEKLVMLEDASASLWKLLLVIAITPAVCEELLFRGLILSGLRRYGQWPAIIISALLFALAHASIYRLLPTFCLGLMLGYIVVKTGSIYCSMLMHALNNGIAVTLARSKDFGERFGLSEATQVPWSITLPAIAVVVIGLLILRTHQRTISREQGIQ
jgi:sodium transport system permease protein